MFDQENGPIFAPKYVVVCTDEKILATSNKDVLQFDPETNKWEKMFSAVYPRLFAGDTNIWVSRPCKQLYPFDASGKIDNKYRKAWFRRSGMAYTINFVIEKDDQIWFGGEPWQRFMSSGLYRFDKSTGEFFKYGPEDGFKPLAIHKVKDGVYAAGSLWLSTSGGLAEVKFRNLTKDKKTDGNK